MVGTVYFKDGTKERIIEETFIRSDTNTLYFTTENGNRYRIEVVAEIVDLNNNEWKIGSRLLYFSQSEGNSFWTVNDKIEKVGIKLEESH